jgi:hypothetical protein
MEKTSVNTKKLCALNLEQATTYFFGSYNSLLLSLIVNCESEFDI